MVHLSVACACACPHVRIIGGQGHICVGHKWYDGAVRLIRFTRSARKHRIGKAHALHVITTVEPELIAATATADARLSWVGQDDRGVELEIVALELDEMWLVIHVMPTSYRERGR